MEENKPVMECITLVDSNDKEYEFVVLKRLSVGGKSYLALAAANEKSERKLDEDFVPDDDITVVCEWIQNGEISYGAVTDADELYAVAKELERLYGHLQPETQE